MLHLLGDLLESRLGADSADLRVLLLLELEAERFHAGGEHRGKDLILLEALLDRRIALDDVLESLQPKLEVLAFALERWLGAGSDLGKLHLLVVHLLLARRIRIANE